LTAAVADRELGLKATKLEARKMIENAAREAP